MAEPWDVADLANLEADATPNCPVCDGSGVAWMHNASTVPLRAACACVMQRRWSAEVSVPWGAGDTEMLRSTFPFDNTAILRYRASQRIRALESERDALRAELEELKAPRMSDVFLYEGNVDERVLFSMTKDVAKRWGLL